MGKTRLRAPFPAIGGKGRVASLVWGHLGDVRNYCEPFCRSAAVLLARPHPGRIETVNDIDHFIVNAWRAIRQAPEEVAKHADWPVTEADLHARHLWLMCGQGSAEFRERMRKDSDHFDAKRAGWWIWGACCWIGSGWCEETGEVIGEDRRPAPSSPTAKRPKLNNGNSEDGCGVNRKVDAEIEGVSAKIPRLAGGREGDLYYGGLGVNSEVKGGRPQLNNGTTTGGVGVHRLPEGRPQLADAFARGRGVHGNDHAGTCAERRAWLVDWMHRLQDRLRNVRVCCGDWARVCSSPSVTTRLGTTGIFLDPPYSLHIERMHAWTRHLCGQGPLPEGGKKATNRSGNLYGSDACDVDQLVARVHVYCRTMGANPEIRIVLAGYAGEHDALEGHGWEVIAWKGSGYGNRGANKANAARERLWVSPHCRRRERGRYPLFQMIGRN